jgi:hypothetical protein
MSDIDQLLTQIPLAAIAQELGVDESQAAASSRTALEALLGGLQANASDPAGALSLGQALGTHDGSRLQDQLADDPRGVRLPASPSSPDRSARRPPGPCRRGSCRDVRVGGDDRVDGGAERAVIGHDRQPALRLATTSGRPLAGQHAVEHLAGELVVEGAGGDERLHLGHLRA